MTDLYEQHVDGFGTVRIRPRDPATSASTSSSARPAPTARAPAGLRRCRP
ncbi:hypothetical protein ACWCQS_14885 [Streptomyces sp. NPDC002076]